MLLTQYLFDCQITQAQVIALSMFGIYLIFQLFLMKSIFGPDIPEQSPILDKNECPEKNSSNKDCKEEKKETSQILDTNTKRRSERLMLKKKKTTHCLEGVKHKCPFCVKMDRDNKGN